MTNVINLCEEISFNTSSEGSKIWDCLDNYVKYNAARHNTAILEDPVCKDTTLKDTSASDTLTVTACEMSNIGAVLERSATESEMAEMSAVCAEIERYTREEKTLVLLEDTPPHDSSTPLKLSRAEESCSVESVEEMLVSLPELTFTPTRVPSQNDVTGTFTAKDTFSHDEEELVSYEDSLTLTRVSSHDEEELLRDEEPAVDVTPPVKYSCGQSCKRPREIDDDDVNSPPRKRMRVN